MRIRWGVRGTGVWRDVGPWFPAKVEQDNVESIKGMLLSALLGRITLEMLMVIDEGTERYQIGKIL